MKAMAIHEYYFASRRGPTHIHCVKSWIFFLYHFASISKINACILKLNHCSVKWLQYCRATTCRMCTNVYEQVSMYTYLLSDTQFPCKQIQNTSSGYHTSRFTLMHSNVPILSPCGPKLPLLHIIHLIKFLFITQIPNHIIQTHYGHIDTHTKSHRKPAVCLSKCNFL